MSNTSPDLKTAVLTRIDCEAFDAERTFWDKLVILHGFRRWFDIRSELRGNGQRVSRHYYDVYQLLASEKGMKLMHLLRRLLRFVLNWNLIE